MQGNSTVVITGTTSGLGLALLGELHGKVQTLHCFNRRRDPELEAKFPKATFHRINIVALPEVKRTLEPILKSAPGPLYVFLNAAVNLVDNQSHFDHEVFREVVEINTFGYSTLVSVLEENPEPKARVIGVGSTAVFVPNLQYIGYHVSKVSNHNLLQTLQRCRTHHTYKLAVLGPILSRMALRGKLTGIKKFIFERLALTPEQAAKRLLRFADSRNAIQRITIPAFLFYWATSYALWIVHLYQRRFCR